RAVQEVLLAGVGPDDVPLEPAHDPVVVVRQVQVVGTAHQHRADQLVGLDRPLQPGRLGVTGLADGHRGLGGDVPAGGVPAEHDAAGVHVQLLGVAVDVG